MGQPAERDGRGGDGDGGSIRWGVEGAKGWVVIDGLCEVVDESELKCQLGWMEARQAGMGVEPPKLTEAMPAEIITTSTSAIAPYHLSISS